MSTNPSARRFNPWLIALGIALLGLFVAAGVWQVGRAHYKMTLQTQMEHAAQEAAISLSGAIVSAHALDFHKLVARGRWTADKTVFIDNKVSNGVIGYHVITPLCIEGRLVCVLVNRGWVAAPALRSELPHVETPPALIEVRGIARIPTERFLELSTRTVEGRVWQNLTIERFHQWSGLILLPVVLYQDTPADAELLRVTPAPEAAGLGADRHWGYAFMWFSLAVLTLILIVVTTLKAAK